MPISYTCPHCGAHTQVDERYAGLSGPCASCGEMILIPGGPAAGAAGGSSGKSALLIVAAVMIPIVLVCGGILAAILIPAIGASQQASRRMRCTMQMKSIGLAMHNYHDTFGSFPPAYLADEDGKPMHSWRVLILPFLEERVLHDQYDFSKPWDSPENQALADLMPKVYRCPSSPDERSTDTSYVVIVGEKTMFPGAESVGIIDISDGVSHTIMVVEMENEGTNWLEPKDLDVDNVASLSEATSASSHAGLRNVVMADGSVQAMGLWLDEEILRALAERDDGIDASLY